jgi:TolB-like protein/Tfp pilus assembly protein PilF
MPDYTPSARAVFLSYASQDAEAAKRICDALRAAGVEVWFDQSELRGGDAWDQKIRRQIRECALFVPLITPNTNARPEGYFRLEWKLAVDRSHLIADDQPFLFPIVIGDVTDGAARVPDKFREVQWTRLRLDETPAELAGRVMKLLGREVVAGGVDTGPDSMRSVTDRRRKRDDKPAWLRHAWSVVGLAFVAYYLLIRPIWRRAHPGPEKPVVEQTADAAQAVAAAQKLQETVGPKPSQPAAEAAEKSVAVLAFANLSDDKGNEYFSDGISEELLNVLAKIPGLKVSARTSSFHFKGKDTPVPEIARQLDVAYVVEGSVRRAGDKVRITAQLIKAADGFRVWSDTFTRELKDVFAVQDEIAGVIAKNLSLRMNLGAARREVNPEAHRLVLEGRYYWNLRTDDGFARAETAFRSAIALDAEFAEAHAGLANVLATVGAYRAYAGLVDPNPEAALQEAQRATQLDPTLAEAYPALGLVYNRTRRHREAEQVYRKALELNPNYALPHHWHSIALETEGRIDEALAEIEQAIRLDPLSAIALVTRRRMLTEAGQPAAALAAYEREQALVPDRPSAAGYRALCLLELGRREEAVDVARQVAAMPTMELRLWADADIIYLLRQTGHEAEAAEHATRILPRFHPDSYQRGAVLAALGRWDEAEPFLERTPVNVQHMFYWSPVWDAWRDDPRFRKLLAKLGCEDAHRLARAAVSRRTGIPAKL